jgi:hypothetical protein
MFTGVLLLPLAAGSGRIATAGEVAFSVVSDPVSGPASSHGLRKIMGALKAKRISVEQASIPSAAKGKILIVAGLSTGAGPAALLAKTANVPAPMGAEALPSDTQQFLSPDEAAKNILEGKYAAKILPSESSDWFARTANDVLDLVQQAEERVDEHRNKEFVSTMVDLRMLAHLASYHSWRAKAGVSTGTYSGPGEFHQTVDTCCAQKRYELMKQPDGKWRAAATKDPAGRIHTTSGVAPTGDDS